MALDFSQKKINHAGVTLYLPAWLEEYWPYQLDLQQCPTFCGPCSLGDALVPDWWFNINYGVSCFVHDCEYAVGPRIESRWHVSNERLQRNFDSISAYHISDAGKLKLAEEIGKIYFDAVDSPIGWENFTPQDLDDPMKSETFRKKLARINFAELETAKP